MKRCYYEVLEIDRKATAAQIKTNYRKMALKYHPDKNSEEGSKQRFVEINEAYNVLSDPNERTWYDNNREKLMFNKEDMSKEDIDQYTFGFNIWTYFTTGCFKGYEDGEGGFYAVYRDVFEKMKSEETKAYNLREDLQEDQRKYEGFGDSNTSEDRVLKFYEDWENFVTYKTFTWIEEWDTRDANSRWVRREMEKQNKKQRQGEKKTYVKTIKDLLAYVRKRDPRFITYLNRLKEEEEKKQQEKLEREKEKKKEKEQMKHIKQKLEEERFREIQEYYKKQNQTSNTPTIISHKNTHNNGKAQFEEDDHESQFYCEICEKEFKSENQLRNHEKSKQHKQMVKDIEKEVLLKQQILQRADLQQTEPSPQKKKEAEPENKEEQPSPAKKKKNKKKKNQQKKQQQTQTEEPAKEEKKQEEKKPQPPKQQPKKEESSSEDEDHFMNTLLNNRNKKAEVKQVSVPPQPAPKADKKKPVKVEQSEKSEEDGKEEQRLGMAKLKKQKKAQQVDKNAKANELKCKACGESFSSKTKLFEHINKTGHASTK